MINKEIMEKCLISVTEQLAIIRLAKQYLIKDIQSGQYMGLCWYLECAIRNTYITQNHHDFEYIKDFLPLFIRENAIQFANAHFPYESIPYWWPRDAEGAAKRMTFLDWMEEDLLK